MTKLTHLDEQGRVSMVDVSKKSITTRRAVAEGFVRMSQETFEQVRTADLIPLCHPLPLSKVKLRVMPDSKFPGLRVSAETVTRGVTGVEMEALTAVSIACLTIYDMLKALDKAMEITDIRLLEKQGGKSGDWELRSLVIANHSQNIRSHNVT